MRLFSRKHQEPKEEAQVKQDPLYVPPKDISYCSCGCETLFCSNCHRTFCPYCDNPHVVELPSFGLEWSCDWDWEN